MRFDRTAERAASPSASFDDDSNDASGVFRSLIPGAPFSRRLWGLDLGAGLPRKLSRDGVVAVSGETSSVRAFLDAEFAVLTQEGLGAAPSSAGAEAKRRYLESTCDFMELRHDARTVGVLIGEPEDWGSYYVRSFAVAPAYQRAALIRRFVRECLFEPLAAAGVERVIADTSPANVAMARLFSELRFYATGHNLSERWGPLVRYTKFLDAQSEAAFAERFGCGAPSRHRGENREEEP